MFPMPPIAILHEVQQLYTGSDRRQPWINPVVVCAAALQEPPPALLREKPGIRDTVRWKCWDWNTAIGLGTIALVSAVGWAGVLLLISSL